MFIWALTATAAAVILIFILIYVRIQIKHTRRQLEFMSENQTNMRLTSSMPGGEFNRLIDSINDIVDTSKKIQINSINAEKNLKEAITNISHDIRTPLTSMDGYFQLLAKSDDMQEREHYISIIRGRIESLKDMLEELFTYTKLQNENLELELEQTDFTKTVIDTLFTFYDEFKQRNLEPETDIEESPLYIFGNAEAVRRTVQNLLKNALEHGGQTIGIVLKKADNQAVLTCFNDISEPDNIDMSQIFTRFYKADSARTSSSTGLGLAIAKGLTEKSGGQITANLENNIFSVTVTYPLLGNNQ